jgi:hypothetical protein
MRGCDDTDRTRIENARPCVVTRAFEGVPRFERSTTVLEYRYGLLTIHYQSVVGALDVWCVQKVLVVDRFAGKPQLIRYVPGHWERVLMDAAKVAA